VASFARISQGRGTCDERVEQAVVVWTKEMDILAEKLVDTSADDHSHH
jgi:hypothetical protein